MLPSNYLSKIDERLKSFGMSPDKIRREVSFALNVVNASPTLSQCEPSSVCTSIINAANMGLTLNPEAQECALIARKDRKSGGYKCTVMPMYQGIANLAFRSGAVRQLITQEVREKDQIRMTPSDSNNPVEHTIGFGDRGKPVGYYTIAVYPDGSKQLETMSLAEVIEIREASDGWEYAKRNGKEKDHPWFRWFTGMARKACLKRALKYINTTGADKLQMAISLDNAEYNAPQWMQDKILRLLLTSTYDDEQKFQIEQSVQFLTSPQARDTIEVLEANQLPNHPGYNDRVGKKQIGKQVAAQVANEKA